MKNMRKIVISGADGFIGSNLIKYLSKQHVLIWAIVQPESKTKNRIQGLENVKIVETNLDALCEKRKCFPDKADIFYHFAWQGVDVLERDNMELQLINIELCLQCMKFADVLHVDRFVLPGSTSEYLYYGKPIDENAMPTTPQNAYGSVKAALRYIAQEYAKKCGFDFIYPVITGIYAPDRRDNNVIFYTIDQLLRGKSPNLTKLEQKWDYIAIEDAIYALVLVGEKGKGNTLYAIGHGDNQPLYKYIEIIHSCINPSIKLGIGKVPYDKEILPSSCIDLTAINRDTGYIPQVDFEVGIKKVIDAIKMEYEGK